MTQWAQTCNFCGAPLQGARCPRCKYERKPFGEVVFSGYSDGGGGIAPSLQQTLFATGGREVFISEDFTFAPDDAVVEEFASNTAAGTHDSNDSTQDVVHHADGTTDPNSPAGSGHMEVIYTMPAVTYAGAIAFVRWHVRAWHEIITESGTRTKQVSGIWASTGFVASNTVGTQNLNGVSSPSNFDIDVPLSPLTGLPWTATELNTRKFGVQLDCFTLNSIQNGSESFTHCSEFWIEIWG